MQQGRLPYDRAPFAAPTPLPPLEEGMIRFTALLLLLATATPANAQRPQPPEGNGFLDRVSVTSYGAYGFGYRHAETISIRTYPPIERRRDLSAEPAAGLTVGLDVVGPVRLEGGLLYRGHAEGRKVCEPAPGEDPDVPFACTLEGVPPGPSLLIGRLGMALRVPTPLPLTLRAAPLLVRQQPGHGDGDWGWGVGAGLSLDIPTPWTRLSGALAFDEQIIPSYRFSIPEADVRMEGDGWHLRTVAIGLTYRP